MENIIENNKLIAEFMGWENHVNMGDIQLYKNEGVVKHIGELKYHSSWDWLMPVVEKIESIEGINFVFTVSQIGFINEGKIIISIGSNEPKIKRTYEAVIEFIKWYNENKDK